MTQNEQLKVLQEVQEGADFLTHAEPKARVSFDYDLQMVAVSVAPGPTTDPDPYEALESPWRDAALAALGYGAGVAGCEAYAEQLRKAKGTHWSYVAFFTKYPVNHFAYASGLKVVQHYANDGWGPDEINAVFAHETCHIFGAADEYGACSCGSLHGALQAANGNCVNCANIKQAPCLMSRNELELCPHSRLQLGWGPPIVV